MQCEGFYLIFLACLSFISLILCLPGQSMWNQAHPLCLPLLCLPFGLSPGQPKATMNMFTLQELVNVSQASTIQNIPRVGSAGPVFPR